MLTQTSAYWLAALEDSGVPVGPVLYYDEVFADLQIPARDMVVETSHPVTGRFRVPGVKLSASPGSVRRAAPRSGEHTREVLTQHQAAQPLPHD